MQQHLSTIFVIDPEQAMADAIAGMLASDPRRRIWCATTAADARWFWKGRRPDLVIIDPALPDEDGLALCQQMPGNPWIVATSTSRDRNREASYLDVADTFLRKPFMPGQLLARLAALARRTKPAEAPGSISAGLVRLDTIVQVASLGKRRISLTPTEFKLLALLLAHPCQVCTYQMIAECVWGLGYENHQNSRVLMKHHVYHLRAKIGPDAIENVPGLGYRFVPDAATQETRCLEKSIADNQPSPMWQERQEDASVH